MPPQRLRHRMARPVLEEPEELMNCQYEYDRPAKSHVKKIVRYKRSVRQRKPKKLLRILSRLGGKGPVPKQKLNETQVTHEPIKLGQRAILRRRWQSSQNLGALHELYKGVETLANEELDLATTDMDPASELSVMIRLGIRAQYEEELRKMSQMSLVLPGDPEVSLRTQQLLEQFFEAHYLPNEAEQDLLERAARVDTDVLEGWFARKCARVRNQDIMERRLFGTTRLDAAKEVMRQGMIQAIREDIQSRQRT